MSASMRSSPSSRARCSATASRFAPSTASTEPCAMAAPPRITLASYIDAVGRAELTPLIGQVVRVVGLLVESRGPRARIGEICEVVGAPGDPPLWVEVVGFREGYLQSVPLGGTAGIRPGDRLVARGAQASVPAGPQLLGRVVDAF